MMMMMMMMIVTTTTTTTTAAAAAATTVIGWDKHQFITRLYHMCWLRSELWTSWIQIWSVATSVPINHSVPVVDAL
jgi:hypothetical protein